MRTDAVFLRLSALSRRLRLSAARVGAARVGAARASAALLSAALCACSAVPGCSNASSAERRPEQSRPVEKPEVVEAPGPAVLLDPEAPLNVLLILIDGLHDEMPWLGYQRDIAPWLTSFEKRAVSYTRAYSISSATARSVGPLLAGRYPSEMARSGDYFTVYGPENVFVSELATAGGHHTLSAHSHAYFVKETGIGQGFQDFRQLSGTKLNNMDKDNVTSERMAELAMEMLKGDFTKPERRFFAYFHFMDPHAPYLPHEHGPNWGHEPRDVYDQEVRFTDANVGKLVDWALEQPWGKHTVVIISADHGESFGAHNLFKHGYELWEDVIHVPLLIYAPGAHARRIDTPRSHIDLAPTILELMGMRVPPSLVGKSLVPELYGLKPEARPVIADLPRDTLQDRRRALIEGTDKLIAFGDDRYFMLFDLKEDPEEKKDLARLDPDRTKQMVQRYQKLSEDIELREVTGYAQLKGAPEGRKW